MTVIICTSGFHLELARSISEEHFENNLKIVYVPKGKGIKEKIYFSLFFLRSSIRFWLQKDKRSIIPHIFSPWFSLIALASSEVSFYDDGTAYYYNAMTPTNLRSKLYFLLCAKHNGTNTINDVGKSTFLDYLKKSKIKRFYAMFPLFFEGIQVPIMEVTLRQKVGESVEQGEIIYLDSAPHMIELTDAEKIKETLKSIADREKKRILFKEHPRYTTEISRYLSSQEWAEPVSGEYETLLTQLKIRELICVYSSAIMSTYLISPRTNLVTFSSKALEKKMGNIRRVYDAIDVHYIETD